MPAAKAPDHATDAPAATGEEAKAERDMLDIMREHFASQPKMLVKTNADALVQINGYTFMVKAGEKVAVPEEIADMLEAGGYI